MAKIETNNEPRFIGASSDMNDPTGFPNRTDSTIAWSDSTPDYTFSIQPVGTSFDYYEAGVKYTSTGDTVQIDNTKEGIHAIYYDDGVLTSAANPSAATVDLVIRTKPTVCIIYWDTSTATAIYVGEERHGMQMDGSTHSLWHFTKGCEYMSGLGLNTMSVDGTGVTADAQFGIDAGAVSDEDIYNPISAVISTTGLPIYYMLGASADWQKHTEAGFSVRTVDGTSSTNLAYNQYTGGAWQLTDVGSNDFVLCHVFATTEKDNPMIAIMGQEKYNNRSQAREGAEVEILSLILDDVLFPEIRAIATVIFQTNTSYASAVNAKVRSTEDGDDYIDWRNEVISRTEVSTSDHGNLAGLGSDDHTQYLMVAPRASTEVSSATPTIDADAVSFHSITALAAGATFAAPTGTPANGQKLTIRIKDDGTTRTLAWNAIYRAIGADLPADTVASKTLYVGFIYNSTDSKWDCVALSQEA